MESTTRVHVPSGLTPVGKRWRAHCSCGEFTTPRVDQRRATEAFYSEHGYTSPECALCGRSHDRGQPTRMLWDELRIIDDGASEILVCRDFDSCRPLATARQHELDKAAWLELGMRPALRVVR